MSFTTTTISKSSAFLFFTSWFANENLPDAGTIHAVLLHHHHTYYYYTIIQGEIFFLLFNNCTVRKIRNFSLTTSYSIFIFFSQ